MRLDVGRDLGLQRRGQHLPGAVADDLIEQRPARHDVLLVRLHGVVDYLEHGRTFPNQRANAGPDQNQMTSDHPREGAPTHVTPPEGHPQVLIIAPASLELAAESLAASAILLVRYAYHAVMRMSRTVATKPPQSLVQRDQ